MAGLQNIEFGMRGRNLDNLSGGWATYFNGDQTSIPLPAATPTKLTLDASGPGDTREEFLPVGVSGLWNSTTDQFDFSTLSEGDTVDIRIDGTLTTLSNNTEFVLNFVGAIGTSGEFQLPFTSGSRFFVGSGLISRFNSIYMGGQDIITSPSEFRVTATKASEGFVNDMYVRVVRRPF